MLPTPPCQESFVSFLFTEHIHPSTTIPCITPIRVSLA